MKPRLQWEVRQGDALERLRELDAGSVGCCVTSPPYWRQRNYGAGDLELGQEATPELYVERMVEVLAEVRRCLAPDGSLWLNVGDKYAAGGNGGGGIASSRKAWDGFAGETGWRSAPPGFKTKDLTLSPFMLAAALRADGWFLRQVIVWDKMVAPEPPRADRPATGHEYVFLLTPRAKSRVRDPGESWWHRSVWSIRQTSDGVHVAQMPDELARRCVLAGSRECDVVLDPFVGSGTTGRIATRLGRSFLGIDLIPENVELARERIRDDAPLMNYVTEAVA